MQIRQPTGALILLAALHVLYGILLRRFYSPNPSPLFYLYVGFAFAQTALLGIWAGLATIHWAARLFGVAIGITYLAWQPVAGGGFMELLAFFVLSVSGVALLLLMSRRWVRLRHTNREAGLARNLRIHFSIRQMFLLVFLIASFFAMLRWLLPRFPRSDEPEFLAILKYLGIAFAVFSVCWMLRLARREAAAVPDPGTYMTIRPILPVIVAIGGLFAIGRWLLPQFLTRATVFLLLAPCLVCVILAITSVWSVFGPSRPVLRWALVFMIAIGAGLGVVWSLFGSRNGEELAVCSIMAIAWWFLHVSLFVVRSCGFELVQYGRTPSPVAPGSTK